MPDIAPDLVALFRTPGVAFGAGDDGASREDVARAERELGFPLPESYKRWLLAYNGGQLHGDLVLGLPDFEDRECFRPNVLHRYASDARSRVAGRLVFYVGNELEYFFDLTRWENGEYPVFEMEDAREDLVRYHSPNFDDFLRRIIPQVCRSA